MEGSTSSNTHDSNLRAAGSFEDTMSRNTSGSVMNTASWVRPMLSWMGWRFTTPLQCCLIAFVVSL